MSAPHDAAAPSVVIYVVGGAGSDRDRAWRDFPLFQRDPDEPEAAHAVRVARRIDQAIASGATHLLVPRERADWLGDHPRLVDYFADHHDLVKATPETGILFALRSQRPLPCRAEIQGWETLPGASTALIAPRRLIEPRLTLFPAAPARGLCRGRLAFRVTRLPTLRVSFVLARPDRHREHRRDLYLSALRPGYFIHQLPYAHVKFGSNGDVEIDFDLRLDRGRSLQRIEIAPAEEDNWRLHPMYPGGESFAQPAVAPAGATFALQDLALEPALRMRQGVQQGTVHADRPLPYRKASGRARDAVIFSSWVPEEGLPLGDYFIDLLRRYHADSKLFIGVNHGSSPRWRERLLASGLDVTIRDAPVHQSMRSDPTGFVAALDAYRRHAEPFDLVWFGHTKGLSHIDEFWYATGRWMIERMYWSRREQIEQHFTSPAIGLYAPHYLMMLQNHLAQTDVLQRIYRAGCAPLGMMAVSTHFVMRDESLRTFCRDADPRFFRDGPEPFGGDIYFFEMAMPNVPIMQGYEPAIEPGLGGTSGPPAVDGVESILKDWRQNNAVVAIELEKWRQDPTHFRTRHCEHRHVD